ncbi:virB8 family protein [Photobacterium damselae]|uniref:virB8 family protein n=1 Tax=Photobacterium damselae TaxID=38293 RepID=UPI00165D85FC|nr:type IV secretion system protein [Photobacterium damselae]
MILSKKTPDRISDSALDFEASKSVMIAKSEKRAWTIVKVTCGLTILSWLALVLLMPLKQTVPYVVTVDKNSGQSQVVNVLDTQTETVSEKEVLNNYWLSNYVRWREVYDWYTLQQDYDNTLAFSAPNVQTEYASIFTGKDALDSMWGKRIKATVEILSIVNNMKSQIATIRFEKTVKNVEDTGDGKKHVWIATIGYRYAPDKKMSAQERLINPLGFEVTSYRVDREMI